MNKFLALLSFVFLTGFLAQSTSAQLCVVVDFGNGEVTNSGTMTSSTTGVTGLTAGVSFDLSLTANNFWGGTGIGAQNLGIGVQGGQANAGIDNNFNGSGGTDTTVTESMDIAVSNLMGGFTIEIVEFSLLFGADAGANTEFYSVDNGTATGIVANPQAVSLAAGTTSFNVGALDDDGITGSDSRYALDSITVKITQVPEPSSAALLLGAATTLLLRRRK